jgi:murein hydrolase activator
MAASSLHRRRRRRLQRLIVEIAVAALCVSATVGTALGAAPVEDLKRTEQELQRRETERRQLDERAAKLEEERLWLSAQMVALADETRLREVELAEIESALETLRAEEADKAAAMEAEQTRLAALLAALQRAARVPPEAALIRPEAPADALRSALVLRDLVPAFRHEAALLARGLEQLAEVRRRLEEQRAAAAAAAQDLAARARQIAVLAAKRETLARQTDAERHAAAQRVARLGAQAGDLRQLMERVEQDRRAAAAQAAKREAERQENERRVAQAQEAARLEAEQEAQRREAEKKESERKAAEAERKARQLAESQAAALGAGGLRRPAAGRVAVRFGQSDRTGGESRGLTIAGRAGSAVVSPSSGSIMYAGPFRNFGLILIVEHGNGYHSLLAGLGRIDVAVGRHVAAGEPLGTLPEQDENGDAARDLYFELRNNGRPVDPERGFGDKQGKGHG